MATAKTYKITEENVTQVINIKMPIGDAYRHRYTLQRDTGTASAVTLVGVAWAMTVSDKRGGTAVLEKTTTTDWTATGVHVDTATSGEFSVFVLPADCTTLTTGEGWWELEATFDSTHADFPSMVSTIMHGALTVESDATNA